MIRRSPAGVASFADQTRAISRTTSRTSTPMPRPARRRPTGGALITSPIGKSAGSGTSRSGSDQGGGGRASQGPAASRGDGLVLAALGEVVDGGVWEVGAEVGGERAHAPLFGGGVIDDEEREVAIYGPG